MTFRHDERLFALRPGARLRASNGEAMLEALRGALDGVTVVALATNIPGPLAAAQLRAFGARVVKIEPARGDALEAVAPQWYAAITAGLEILRIDLRDDAALRTLDAHLQSADIVITAMRASSLLRIGFEWNALHARYPNLVHVAISGDAPPHDDRAGHDLTYQARAGMVAPPAMPRTLSADMAAAERAVSASVAALLQRDRTGNAVRVDVSIVDAAMDFGAPFRYGLSAPGGTLGGGLPLYGIYPAKDGYVAVAALEPHFSQRLHAMLERETLDETSLAAALLERSAHEWEALAQQYDVPLAAVLE